MHLRLSFQQVLTVKRNLIGNLRLASLITFYKQMRHYTNKAEKVTNDVPGQ